MTPIQQTTRSSRNGIALEDQPLPSARGICDAVERVGQRAGPEDCRADLDFRPGCENRRIDVTMPFGYRRTLAPGNPETGG